MKNVEIHFASFGRMQLAENCVAELHQNGIRATVWKYKDAYDGDLWYGVYISNREDFNKAMEIVKL